MVKELLKFYFFDFDDKIIDECLNSYETLFYHIKSSKFSYRIKSNLYEFFLDPYSHIEILYQELKNKELLLSEYYKENYKIIENYYKKLTHKTITDLLFKLSNIIIKSSQNITVSYCLLNRVFVYLCCIEDGYLTLIGLDYASLEIFPDKYNLNEFGQCIGDENRYKIFNFLIKNKQMSCSDIQYKINISSSTTYHHLNAMVKTGLIKSNVHEKTIFYSLNKNYILQILRVFRNYLNKLDK